MYAGLLGVAPLLTGAPEDVRGDEARIMFTNLSGRSGLSPGGVRNITLDDEGGVWFATESGLTRFDGFQLDAFQLSEQSGGDQRVDLRAIASEDADWFWLGTAGDGLARFHPESGKAVWFRADPAEPFSLSHDSVTALLMQETPGGGPGTLWVGTENGLNRYDRETSHFRRISLGAPIDSEVIRAIVEDDVGQIWVATAASGLFLRSSDGDWIKVWQEQVEISALANDETTLPVTEERKIAEVKAAEVGGVWLATLGAGMFQFNESGRMTNQVDLEVNVLSLVRASTGPLWAGSPRGAGRYDPVTEEWSWYQHQPREAGSLVSGPITAVFEDKQGVLWLGAAAGGGLSRFSLTQTWFPRYTSDLSDPDSLSHGSVHGFAESADGTIWVGTEGGLNRFDPATGKSVRYRHDPTRPGSLPRNFANLVIEDKLGRLWVGTSGGGIGRLDKDMDEFVVYPNIEPSAAAKPGDTITALMEDHEGQIWVAVRGSGIARFEEDTETFTLFKNDAPANVLRHVTDLLEDNEHRIWAATEHDGLWALDLEPAKVWIHYTSLTGEDELTSPNVTDLALGSGGEIWISMTSGGFSRLDPNAEVKLKQFTPELEHLPHSDAWALVQDDEGHIWVSTSAGLIRKDPEARGFRRFDTTDGLQGATFNPKSIYKTQDGGIYVGGPDGFNIIDPANLPQPHQRPRPLLTTLRLYGAPVKPVEGGIIEKPLVMLQSFDLPYDPALSFSVGYGTLNYETSGQLRFQYRLKPIESEWRDGDETNAASYTPSCRWLLRFRSSVVYRWSELVQRKSEDSNPHHASLVQDAMGHERILFDRLRLAWDGRIGTPSSQDGEGTCPSPAAGKRAEPCRSGVGSANSARNALGTHQCGISARYRQFRSIQSHSRPSRRSL